MARPKNIFASTSQDHPCWECMSLSSTTQQVWVAQRGNIITTGRSSTCLIIGKRNILIEDEGLGTPEIFAKYWLYWSVTCTAFYAVESASLPSVKRCVHMKSPSVLLREMRPWRGQNDAVGLSLRSMMSAVRRWAQVSVWRLTSNLFEYIASTYTGKKL